MNLIRLIQNEQNKKGLITFLNPYSYLLARQNTEVFEQFDRIHIDGIALVKILDLFGIAKVQRESFDMTSMAPEVFSDASEEGQTIYFIGTEPTVIDKAVANIQSIYPKLKVIGFRDGYFTTNDEKVSTIKNIVQHNPDIVICGMGTPLQEQFLVDLTEKGWNGTGYTCGGFLHQTANNIQYYPEWIDKYNLRWVYRIYDEPKLFKRYFWEYPKFLAVFIYDYINYRMNNHHLS